MTAQVQQGKTGAPADTDQFPQLPQAMIGPLIAAGGSAVQPALSFGGLLRQLRTQARLTQEELAEVARLSPRSVSDLERGISRTARKDTAGLLAEALSLTGPVREAFVAAARGRSPAADVLAARTGAAPAVFAAPPAGELPSDPASAARPPNRSRAPAGDAGEGSYRRRGDGRSRHNRPRMRDVRPATSRASTVLHGGCGARRHRPPGPEAPGPDSTDRAPGLVYDPAQPRRA